MTAQVVVMNKACLALASDSTATVISAGGSKSYQSVEKIFAIGEGAPYAVMIAGNSSIMDVPVEVLVGQWRSQITESSWNTLDDCVKDLLGWLEAHGDLLREQEDSYFQYLLGDYFSSVATELASLAEQHSPDDLKSDFVPLGRATIVERYNYLSDLPRFDGFDDLRANAYVASRSEKITACLMSALEDVPYASEFLEPVQKLAVFLVCRAEPFPTDTSLVVAGIAQSSTFPALLSIVVSGYLDGSLRVLTSDSSQIDFSTTSVVAPFAQREAVDTFLRGTSQPYDDLGHRGIDSLGAHVRAILQTATEPAEKTPDVLAAVLDAVEDSHKSLAAEREQIELDEFLGPMLEVIDFLPRDEMAVLAESLVGLSVLRRRTRGGLETVGGPIDVAVITRYGGLTWYRHKHSNDPGFRP